METNINEVFRLIGIGFCVISLLMAILILIGGLTALFIRRYNELHNIDQIVKCWNKYGHEFKKLKD